MSLSIIEREAFAHLERLEGPTALLDFVPRYSPQYQRPDHLLVLADIMQRAEVEPVRALFSAPPRHGKTEAILHFIAHYLARFPTRTVCYAAYGDALAKEKSKAARDLALKAGLKLRNDSKSSWYWKTQEGGGLIATSIGGPLTGLGVDLLIVDDQFKDRASAESPTIRDQVHSWFTSTALTRLTPGGSAIVFATRWHADDLIGRLAADQDQAWEYVNLPAIDAEGMALWPTRWSVEALEAKRRDVGPYDWASLYLGQPVADAGALFVAEPPRFNVPDLQGARIIMAVDGATSAKTSSDFSVIVVMAAKGVGLSQRFQVLDMYRAQVEAPVLIAKIKAMASDWGTKANPVSVYVEAVAGFKLLSPLLRQQGVRAIDVNPRGDKFARALPMSAAWADQRIELPESGAWLDPALDELRAFTGKGDAHDDVIDALQMAHQALAVGSKPIRRGVFALSA